MDASNMKQNRFIKHAFVMVTLLFLFSALLFGAFTQVNMVKAADVTTTRTFETSSYDGKIYKTSTNYTTAQTSASGTVSDTSNTATVGQNYVDPNFQLHKAFVPFDTAAIPDMATLNNATLSLYIIYDYSDTDFNITIQDGQPTYPHIPLEAGDYYKGWYGGAGGSRNTSEIVGEGYFNISLSDIGLTYIQTDGTTKICLRSSLEIAGTENSGLELIHFYTAEQGSSYAPKLYVTYTVSSEDVTTIILHGPYMENGDVYDGNTNATLTFDNNSTQTFFFNGSDGSADTHYVDSEVVPISMFWNCTSDYSKQRVYYFTEGASSDEVWLHVADTDTETLAQYYASVTDFAGLTNAYVSIIKNVAGTTRTIERQRLDVFNNMPFWLIFYNQYKLKVTSDQGVFQWDFPADVVGTKSFLITRDMVDVDTTYLYNFTCVAVRTNSTFIYVYYYDPSGRTISVSIDIQYLEDGEYSSAYTDSYDGNVYNFTWNEAETLREYTVWINATYTDTYKLWKFTVTQPETEAFDVGVVLDLLGDWPVEAQNLLGIFIVALFFAVFSWKDVEFACGAGIVISAVLVFFGLLDIPVMALAMGFFIVVFMYIHKGKETSRVPP